MIAAPATSGTKSKLLFGIGLAVTLSGSLGIGCVAIWGHKKDSNARHSPTSIVGARISGQNQLGPAVEIDNSSNSLKPGATIETNGCPGQNVTGLSVSQNGPGTGLKVIQNGPGVGLTVTTTNGGPNCK